MIVINVVGGGADDGRWNGAIVQEMEVCIIVDGHRYYYAVWWIAAAADLNTLPRRCHHHHTVVVRGGQRSCRRSGRSVLCPPCHGRVDMDGCAHLDRIAEE